MRLRNTVLIEEEKVEVDTSRRSETRNLIEENTFAAQNRREEDDWETKEKYSKSTNQTFNSQSESESSEPGLYRTIMDEHVKPFLERKDGYETIIFISIFVILYLISYFTARS